MTLRGWKLNPGKSGALLYFGGNAERLDASRDEFARLFPDRTVYLLSYRGYGASEGQPGEAALFGDALALYDAARARHPRRRYAVIGRSLGSGVASYLASQRPVERLALVTPFDSLAEVAQAHYPVVPGAPVDARRVINPPITCPDTRGHCWCCAADAMKSSHPRTRTACWRH